MQPTTPGTSKGPLSRCQSLHRILPGAVAALLAASLQPAFAHDPAEHAQAAAAATAAPQCSALQGVDFSHRTSSDVVMRAIAVQCPGFSAAAPPKPAASPAGDPAQHGG